MIIDLTIYGNNKAFIQSWYSYQNALSLGEAIGIISAVTFVPVVACAFFIAESVGWTEESLNKIDRLLESYSYEEILGIPESYPRRRK